MAKAKCEALRSGAFGVIRVTRRNKKIITGVCQIVVKMLLITVVINILSIPQERPIKSNLI